MAARQVLLVCCIGWVVGAEYTSHAALLPKLMTLHGFGPTGAAWLNGCFIATLAIVSVPAGHLVDRFGAPRVALAGLAAIALGNLAFAAADGLAALVVAKCLAGLGASTTFIAGIHHANVVLQGRQSFWSQGAFGGSTQLGAASALYLAAVMGELLGWRAAFIAAAAIATVTCLVWLRGARQNGWRRASGGRGRWTSVIANRDLWLLSIAYAEMFGLAFVLGTWTSVLLVRDLGVSLIAAGAAGATFLLVGIIARPGGGALLSLDLLRPRALMALSLATSACALAVLTVRRASLAEVVVLLVVVGIGANAPFAAVMGALHRLAPGSPATAIGVSSTITLALMALKSFLLGWLIALTGSATWAFGFLALAVIAGLVVVAFLPRQTGLAVGQPSSL